MTQLKARETVLVVDNSEMHCEIAATYLLEKFDLLVTNRAQTAEEWIEKLKIQFLVTDFHLDETGSTNGLKLAQHFKKRQADGQCILVSGDFLNNLDYHLLQELEGEFLQKPFSKKMLNAILNKTQSKSQ